eukprot:6202023-Pleurochrysis_carterae.AAC.2
MRRRHDPAVLRADQLAATLLPPSPPYTPYGGHKLRGRWTESSERDGLRSRCTHFVRDARVPSRSSVGLRLLRASFRASSPLLIRALLRLRRRHDPLRRRHDPLRRPLTPLPRPCLALCLLPCLAEISIGESSALNIAKKVFAPWPP